MANDRIFLRCKYCGDRVFLFKYYPTPTRSYVPHEAARFDEFLHTHLWGCHPQGGQLHLADESGFDVVTEGADGDQPPPLRHDTKTVQV